VGMPTQTDQDAAARGAARRHCLGTGAVKARRASILGRGDCVLRREVRRDRSEEVWNETPKANGRCRGEGKKDATGRLRSGLKNWSSNVRTVNERREMGPAAEKTKELEKPWEAPSSHSRRDTASWCGWCTPVRCQCLRPGALARGQRSEPRRRPLSAPPQKVLGAGRGSNSCGNRHHTSVNRGGDIRYCSRT
jgi:hypothetical protein